MAADKLIFEYPWINRVFTLSKEHSLDWLRMSAIALVLSGGDPRARYLDWEFLQTKLEIHPEDEPVMDQLDRGTRWGLFQIHGELARVEGFQGRLVNFVDVGVNTKFACIIMSNLLQELDVDEATAYFGANPALVAEVMQNLRESITFLTQIDEVINVQEEETEPA